MVKKEAGLADRPGPVCGRCGLALHGRYCHGCGLDSAPTVRRMRDLAEDLLDNVFAFTEALPRTVGAMFVRPALAPTAQRAGDRVRFLSPVKLYLAASLAFFLFLMVSGVSIHQVSIERTGEALRVGPPEEGLVSGFRMRDRWLHPGGAAARDAEVVAAIDAGLADVDDRAGLGVVRFFRVLADDPSAVNDTVTTWAPRALWLLMPIHALMLAPLFGRRRLLAEHFIFALWAHALLFLLLIIGAAWNMTGLPGGLVVALALYQIYLTVAARGYYDTTWVGAAGKGAVHTTLYLGLVWLPLTLGFFIAQAVQHAPPALWES